jgi:uncharacterized protein (DUF302 family)
MQNRSIHAGPDSPCPAQSPQEITVLKRITRFVPIAAIALSSISALAQTMSVPPPMTGTEDGIIKVRSAYSVDETVARVRQDVAGKGIMFFQVVDQQKLAADAGIKLRPSTLLVFGNPPLGTLFIKANPVAGLDWPVRLLVFEDENGQVWTAYTDFAYIAHRHRIQGMDNEAFQKASGVIASITSSVAK